MRRNLKTIKLQEKNLTLDMLYNAIQQIPGPNSTRTFVDTLLTESEKITIGRRILIAQMILSGDSQREICGQLGVSPNTVSITRRWLEEKVPNYDKSRREAGVNSRPQGVKQKNVHKEHPDPLTFAGLQRKYPAHFLLFSAAQEVLKKLSKK